MRNRSQKLTFFCQMCNEVIDSNICTTHGIDFVTIRKLSEVSGDRAATKKTDGASTMLAKAKNADPPVHEKGLAISDPSDSDAQLPVLSRGAEINRGLEAFPVSVNGFPVTPQKPIQTKVEQEEIYYDPPVDSPSTTRPGYEYPNYQVYRSGKTNTRRRNRKKSNLLLYFGTALAICVLCVLGYMFVFDGPSVSPTTLYSQAENMYNQQDFASALSLYNQFLAEYPNDPLAPMVEEKLNKLNRMSFSAAQPVQVASQPASKPVRELMVKANAAFQQKRLTIPVDDNAMLYISKALIEQPDYLPALQLKAEVIQYYIDEAEQALADGNRKKAIENFQLVLKLDPNNREIKQQIQSLLDPGK